MHFGRFPLFKSADLKRVVMAHSVLHLLEDKEQAIADIHNMLKPSGIFVTSTACIGDMMLPLRLIDNPLMSTNKRHRFPPDIISYAVCASENRIEGRELAPQPDERGVKKVQRGTETELANQRFTNSPF